MSPSINFLYGNWGSRVHNTRFWESSVRCAFQCLALGKDGRSIKSASLPWIMVRLVAQMVKNLPAIQETWVWPLGWEDPLEKGTATQFSVLAWRVPWTEEPGGLQPMGVARVRQDWATNTFSFRTLTFLLQLWELQGRFPIGSCHLLCPGPEGSQKLEALFPQLMFWFIF